MHNHLNIIQVFNFQGALVYNHQPTLGSGDVTINIKDLFAGTYMIKITSGDIVMYKPFIKTDG